jgi:hypothetical protein
VAQQVEATGEVTEKDGKKLIDVSAMAAFEVAVGWDVAPAFGLVRDPMTLNQ